jgi:F-type H+-transporting ATPase subunit O
VNHAPPIKLFGIAGRYAGATYTAASKDGILEKVEAEMGAFSAVLKKSTQFANFIENPTVPREQKVAQLSALLSEDKFSHITRNLFITLSANGRGDEALKVIELFEDLIRANRGVVKVVIVSAEPLSKKIVASLQAPIMALAGENKTVSLMPSRKEISYMNREP